MRIRGEGMPQHGANGVVGDLLVNLNIDMPTELTASQRAAIMENF